MARSTRAPAATAARAERRRLASSKFASRLAVARTSRRIRRSSQAISDSWAPSRVSSWPIASPSRITTRSTPRTSRALAWMPSRRATPTRASAASGPGQVTSSAEDRPGSVSEPWARNAPRQAATASQPPPDDDRRRQAAHRAAALVEQAGLAGQRLAVLDDADDVAAALADAVALHHHDVGLVAVDLGDVRAQPPGRGAGVELGLDHDPAAHDVQPAGEPQHRRDLRLAAAGLRDLGARQLRLHLCRHRHGADPVTRVNDPRAQDPGVTPPAMIRVYAAASRPGRGAGCRRPARRRRRRSSAPYDATAARRSSAPSPTLSRSASTVWTRRSGRVLDQHREVVRGAEARGLPRLRRRG